MKTEGKEGAHKRHRKHFHLKTKGWRLPYRHLLHTIYTDDILSKRERMVLVRSSSSNRRLLQNVALAIVIVETLMLYTMVVEAVEASLKAFNSFEEYEESFTQSNILGGTVPPSSIKWPQYVPPGPFYFDTDCFGRFEDFCPKASPNCRWYTYTDPTCYDRRFVSVTIPPAQIENQKSIPLHVKFFQFNFGVHLVEGTFFKRFYGLTVDECARRCLVSAAGFPSAKREKLRCMSFDFYPFEVWIAEAPYNERQDTGICVLNNETKDSARMRNEDQGLTNAELYYKSHCSRRPFSPLDGYYEVRDPRGTLSPLLEYAGPSSLGLESPWGGSRWGMFHPNLPGYIPQPLKATLDCRTSSAEDPSPPTFRGGFTPINDEQKCPGLMTKTQARELCAERGGELCQNQTDLNNISGRKLGCSFDQSGKGQIWHEGIVDKNQKLYPRCCASYSLPLNDIVPGRGVCEAYEEPNIQFCTQFKTVTECEYSHNMFDPQSKYRPSWRKGFAHGLDDIRAMCKARTAEIPEFNCTGMDVGPWTSITNCIWCPQAGLLPVGGNGQCRPGGSYGICPTASDAQRTIFGIQVRSACSEQTNCALLRSYPDLAPFMGNFTTDSVFTGEDASETPTKKPTTKAAAKPTTRFPTNWPTTRFPTAMPTSASPTTGTPTLSPSSSPPTHNPLPKGATRKPTSKPTSKAPSKSPTVKPTASIVAAAAKTTSRPSSYVLPNFDGEEE